MLATAETRDRRLRAALAKGPAAPPDTAKTPDTDAAAEGPLVLDQAAREGALPPPARVVNVPPNPRPAFGPALLSVEGLVTDGSDGPALRQLSFEVPLGEVTAVLGPGGGGQTTVLRVIMGLCRARAGRLFLGGQDITGWPPMRVARQGVGYVPAEAGLFMDLTVAENIALGVIEGRPARDRLDWILTRFPALQEIWTVRARRLTGAQGQMLVLARAMVDQRRIYLIDTPTDGYAAPVAAALSGALRDLKDQGATLLIATGDRALAGTLAENAVVLDGGRAVWKGRIADLPSDSPPPGGAP